MKKFRFLLEYLIIRVIGHIVHILPRRLVLFLGARAGDFIFYCVPIRKKITISHLTRAFPEKAAADISAIARRVYQNLGMNSLEHLCLPGLSKERLSQIVSFEGEAVLQNAFSRNRGVVLVGGHFGNWEYMGAAISSKGYPVTYIIAQIENPYIDMMVNSHREKTGIKILSKGISVRTMLRTLRDNGSMAMLMDQDAGRNGIFLDFFNAPCSTPKGPALFALKTGAAIIFVSSIRQKDGSLRAVFEGVDVDYEKGPTDENIHAVMQKCTNILESYVKKYPDHWFWMHRRWKTSPQ